MEEPDLRELLDRLSALRHQVELETSPQRRDELSCAIKNCQLKILELIELKR
jgi:hypothetical protein